MIHSSLENFQPEPPPNSEQKADKMHVSPAIANANVSGSFILSHEDKCQAIFQTVVEYKYY